MEKIKQLGQTIKHYLQTANRWKIAFMSLMAIIVGLFVFVFVRFSEPREVLPEKPATEQALTPVMVTESTKKQLNQLISFYLDDFQKNSDVQYTFLLENEAVLTGEFKLLNFPLHFYLYFDPYVTETGNVQLKARSLSIGTLGVPIKEVMKMAQRSYKLPKWVEIDPEEETIYLRLDQFKMKNGMYVRAEKINLVDDEIKFSLYLPETKE